MSSMSGWLGALRTYILVIGVGNLAWETAHLPLYTIWSSGSIREQVTYAQARAGTSWGHRAARPTEIAKFR